MDQEITGGYKDIQPVPCCLKCGMPKEDIVEAFKEVVVIRCQKCHSIVAAGYVTALRAKCSRCGAFVAVI